MSAAVEQPSGTVGHIRTIAMTDPVRERLLTLPRESQYVFTTLRGNHYRPSSRSHHWNRVRCSAGLGSVDLYTSTRYGHADARLARERVREAFRTAPTAPVPLAIASA